MSTISNGQEIDIDEITAEELNALPAEALNDLPALEVFEKIVELEDDMSSFPFLEMVQVMLYEKYYAFPDSPPLQQQIMAFQEDNGFEPTGELTMGQFEILGESPDVYGGRVSFSFAYLSVYQIDNQYARATGTWEIIGENHAYPLNISEIICRDYSGINAAEGQCIDTKTYVDDSFMAGFISEGGEDEYKIVSWDDNQLIASASGGCRNITLTLNFSTEEVTSVATNNNEEGCSIEGLTGTVNLPPLTTPRVSVLRDTDEMFDQYYEDKRAEIEKGWSKDYLDFIKELQNSF